MEKIKRIEIHNLKGIDALKVDIDGHHIMATGKNRVGKSTFLQSILFGLGRKADAPPVREGEKEGEVHIWTEGGTEFHSERDAIKGITKVSVKLPGEKLFDTRVTNVGAITGEISFDPFQFAELSKKDSGRKEQVEFVKKLLSDEERMMLAKFQRDIQANEESRTQTGRDKTKMEGKVNSSKITPEDIEKYKEPVRVDELMKQKKEADDHNTKRAGIIERFDERKLKIIELKKQLEELEKSQSDAAKWIEENPLKPVTEINTKISESSDWNEKCSSVKEFCKDREELTKLQNAYGEEQALIESQREAYRQAIRSLDLPIPDLYFDDEKLIWKDRPVDSSVLSTSEIMSLGFMIRMAMNPDCPVVVIHRGESFDRESLNELINEADNYGLQLFIEKVVSDQQDLRIEFLTVQPS